MNPRGGEHARGNVCVTSMHTCGRRHATACGRRGRAGARGPTHMRARSMLDSRVVRGDTQYAYAIRSTQAPPRPPYAIRIRNTQDADGRTPPHASNTQYASAIRKTQSDAAPGTQYHLAHNTQTQYAIRNTQSHSSEPSATRNTQYAIRIHSQTAVRYCASTQYAGRNAQVGSEFVLSIRNAAVQYAALNT